MITAKNKLKFSGNHATEVGALFLISKDRTLILARATSKNKAPALVTKIYKPLPLIYIVSLIKVLESRQLSKKWM